MCRPNLFFTDSTFGTNKEEYKLHLPTYVSVVTVETEVACYIFLATETKENVEDGLKAWKSVIPYTEEDVGGCFYIYIDKDFEYKRILEKTFACIVLLCSIHIFRSCERSKSFANETIFRYWKDKILPSAIVAG